MLIRPTHIVAPYIKLYKDNIQIGMVLEYDTQTHIAKCMRQKAIEKISGVELRVKADCPAEIKKLLSNV
jgi:hypothetical protein